ncbi:O-antigen ligase family protein [Streptomyces gilvus]|uniref:O-antigen ligase family protein n=1 Tax=Streptomyces gilvus TaxID=2920937 RepID=UPI001F0F577E|nr:O-antigen ligase family protein [Streptomyces sp. CME 23]MCH5670801.1 O-antigen ligase family protein [Streptomyces sp. CME 23]
MATVTAADFVPERAKATARDETLTRTTALVACVALVFQPVLRPAGPGNSSPVDVFTLATVLMSVLWAATCGRRLGAPYTLAGALMLLSGALAGLAGPLPGTSLMNVSKEILLLAWCVALYNLARRPGVLRLFTATFAYSAVVWASVLVVGSLAHIRAIEGISATEGDRKLFTLGDPNYAATFWVVSLFMVYATRCPRRRPLRWLGYVMLVWALLLSQSNGGVVMLGVGLVFVAAHTAWRKGGVVAGVAVVLAIALAVGGALTAAPLAHLQNAAQLSNQTELVNTVGRSGASSEQRGTLVHESLQLYQEHWLTGSGPGTTKQLLTDQNFAYAKEAHDDYLAALVERGPLGVIGLLTLVLSAAWRSARALRAPPGSRFAAQVPRPAGLVAGLAGLAVAGAYYEVLHFRFLWVLLAMVAVLASAPEPDGPDRPGAHGELP